MTDLTTAPPATVAERGRARVSQLRDAVSGLRTRATRQGFDHYLFLAGCVLVPLGLLAILLGWYGAANSAYQFELIPYLISGGILGLALTTVGCFAYFGYWLTRVHAQQRADTDRLVQAINQLMVGLGEPVVDEAASTNGEVSLVATPTGTMVHLPTCPVVAGKDNLRAVDPDDPDLEPCKLCEPPL